MKYVADVTFSFRGKIFIEADSVEDAKEMLNLHVGCTTDRFIHSTLNDEDVDWDFSVHADKRIHKIRKA